MTIRVAYCGTGMTGRHGLRGVINHPDLTLVGQYVSTPDKVGRDAGDIVGLPPTGVIATNDLNAIIALKPDCVAYGSKWVGREEQAMSETIRFLEAGIDVASFAHLPLCNPPRTLAHDLQSRIEAACAKGGSRFLNSGYDPGFLEDALPLTLLSMMDRVDCVRLTEIGCYDHYSVENVLRGVFGFGMSEDYLSPFFKPGGMLEQVWGPLVHLIADTIGVPLDDLNIVCNKVLTEVPLQVKIGTIDAGTVAGLHFALEGRVDGVPRVIVEHYNRMKPEVAPHWPQVEISDEVAYKLVIEGEPTITCTLDIAAERPGEEGVEVATAMRVINAIPSLRKAKPGMIWAAALPAYVARNAPWRKRSG